MTTTAEIEKTVWKEMERAMNSKDARALSILSEVASDLETKKAEWERKLRALSSDDGAGRGVNSTPKNMKNPGARNYSHLHPRAYLLDGNRFTVKSFKELLIDLSNRLRSKHGQKFDQAARNLRGRTRLYFANTPNDLFDNGKYGQALVGGGLFVETNLNATLIVNNICI